ncbi:insulin receptor substrate 1-B-like isoform X5 [Asterias rubens]|uniref:insulin receptor substrate 1-B-like isoform X5 n=1 Tax=Asterias rubens TaxID=7604 RepID=UPI001455A263|nr:insulin receptor substrate 1-B-like isoform X5 [Asterias rubens]
MTSQKENIPGPGDGSDIVKSGYLKKLKTMRKKFFVLRCESSTGPARLEYFDSEKKFRIGSLSKRTIDLKTCFNINKKSDSKHKHAIALYTRDDCFPIVADDENALNEWLQALLLQQQVDADGVPVPTFEHVWQVTVKPKGLGSSKGLSGNYRLCLTTTTINLVKMNCEDEDLEFSLSAIRRCGHSDCFFFMEVGRQSMTGAGEIWMQVEDTVIAQNIHEASLNAMRSISQQEEEMRPRSQSSGNTSEMKPNSSRRQVSTLGPSWRTRCESMPAQNRPRTNRSRLGSGSEESLQEEPSPTSGPPPSSSISAAVIRPRTQSEGEGNHIARMGGSSLLKYGIKSRPRTASEGESHFRSGRTPERFSGSGRSRTPDSPTRTPIREESIEFTDEYMNMTPSAATKAVLTVHIPTRPPLHHHMINTRGRSSPSSENDYVTLQPVQCTLTPPSPPSSRGRSPSPSKHIPPPAPPDEDQSYMSMTPMTRGSRGSSGYASHTQNAPQLAQRSASVSGRMMTVPQSSEDEGYMMMAPRGAPNKKRGSTGSRDALKTPTSMVDQPYTMMQPVPKHHGNSTAPDGNAAKPTGNSLAKSRGSGSTSSGINKAVEPKMKPSEILVRSLSDSKEPIVDTYMTMEFQPKNSIPKSPIPKPDVNVNSSMLDDIDEGNDQLTAYDNAALPEALVIPKPPESDYTFMVPSSRPANPGKEADRGSQSAVESLLKGLQKAESSSKSEYMNVEFSPKGGPVDVPPRPMPPLPIPVPQCKRDGADYMNVETGQNVKPHRNTSPQSPPSPQPPQWSKTSPALTRSNVLPQRNPSTPPSQSPKLSGGVPGRRAADLKYCMDELSLNDTGSGLSSRGSANSLTALQSGSKSCEPSPGPPSRHSSCRSSQTSLADKELNYIDVDIGQPDANNVPVPLERRARSPFTRRAAEEEKPVEATNYATIDFTKSEGLRTATSTRENRPV